jgi:acyl carrier protein
MNTQQQAYIEGFVKRASEYGFSEAEAVELLKSAVSYDKSLFKKTDAPVKSAGLTPKLNIIFAEQLGTKVYDKNNTFGGIGADRLDKLQLLIELEKHYKKDLSESLISSHMKDSSTIGDLLKHIENKK